MRRLVAAVTLALVASGCPGEDAPEAEPAAPSPTTTSTEPSPTPAPAQAPEPTGPALPPVSNPRSLPARQRSMDRTLRFLNRELRTP